MAVPDGSFAIVAGSDESYETKVGTWTLTSADHTGATANLPEWPAKSIQVTGAFGGTGSVALEGSNDGVNFAPLRDLAGDVIAITSAGLVSIMEETAFVRPRLTVVGTAATLVISLFLRRPNTMRQ